MHDKLKFLRRNKSNSPYQVFWLDNSVDDFPEKPVILFVFDVEQEAAVFVLVLKPNVAVVKVEHIILDFVTQLKMMGKHVKKLNQIKVRKTKLFV